MPSNYIETIGRFLEQAEFLSAISQVLFRGQDRTAGLLPKIARDAPKTDSTALERSMLNELKRRVARSPTVVGQDDWDALVVAQHYGMATRLLDWSTNPLVALWFACADRNDTSDGFVYMLPVTSGLILDRSTEPDPFEIARTRVFKPSINNDRLMAQSGWFTAHRFSTKSRRFVELQKNTELNQPVLVKGVHGADKSRLLRSLDRVGINQESMFPGLEGTCRYVDWQFRQRDA